MITIFTIPKPFVGLDDIHQRNAIQSWLAIRPECEIILCGNDQGVVEAAKEFGVVHISDVPMNEFGTPYLDAAFQQAQQIATNDLICYVNADILFFDDLMDVVSSISFDKFLLVGRRWNLEVNLLVNFQDPEERTSLREHAFNQAALNRPLGSDYFVFKKNSLGELPNFLVGRPYWDNWMIYNARSRNIPVIDCSQAIVDVHQNHDYAHVPQGINNSWYGPEAESNDELVGKQKVFSLWDSTHLIDASLIITRATGDQYIKRKIQTLSVLKNRSGIRLKWLNIVQKMQRIVYDRRNTIPRVLLSYFVDVTSKLS